MIDVVINGQRLDLSVSELPYPPIAEQKTEIWSQFLTDDGTSSGTVSMMVGAGDVPYWVEAIGDGATPTDLWITHVSFVIGDATAALNEFGAQNPLDTPCEFYYRKANGDTVTIADDLITNWTFVRMCLGNPAFGDGADSFRAKNVLGGAEAFLPVYDFTKVMPPYGLLLAAGSGSKLVLEVKDKTDDVDVFNARAYGFKRYV